MTQIVGILNVTRDSFSDGGTFLEPEAAVAHARQLVADGADVIDLGAESTHPDAEDVPSELEIARLTPVIEALKRDGVRVSVDTHKPPVIRHALSLGADFINDVTALRDPESVAAVRDGKAKLIIMHSRTSRARAERIETDSADVVDHIIRFFEQRAGLLAEAGVGRERLIIDPGMGFFLGRNPGASLAVLRDLKRLRTLALPILISTSRKSFIGAILGSTVWARSPDRAPRPVGERGAGTLATEIWAAQQGVEYVRTHDVRALRDALTMLAAICGEGSRCSSK